MEKIKSLFLRYGNFIRKQREKNSIRTLLDKIVSEDVEKTTEIDKNNKDIVFVLPDYSKSGGGFNSLLKLGDRLGKYGYNIWFTCPLSFTVEQAKSICDCNYKTTNIKFLTFENALNRTWRFVFSTLYLVYLDAKKLKGKQAIFLQDYEIDFFEKGDYTYLFDHVINNIDLIITLGEWIPLKLISRYGDDIKKKTHSVKFPVDFSYLNIEKKINNDKDINICIYNRNTPRRFPYTAEYIADTVEIRLKEKGYNCTTFFFGNSKKYIRKNHNDLCVISSDEIKELYKKCSFGIALSATNVSLVPFEMTLAKVKNITIDKDSYNDFTNWSIVFNNNIDKLVSDIIEWHELDADKKEEEWNKVVESFKTNNWDDISKEVFEIINSL